MNIAELNAEIRSLCDADATSYSAADLLRRVNNSLETLVGKIINADGTWQFDDSNYSDLPVGTQTLVASQSAYTFNDKFLQILEILVKDINGDWIILNPTDQVEMPGNIPLDEAFESSGLPIYYDKVSEDTIKLYPAPSATNCTLTNGLKIKFKRTASIFTTAEVNTGTKVPGIASPFHILIAYLAAIPYCMTYKKDRVALYQREVEILTKDMLTFYALREKDVKNVMTMAPVRGGRGWR
jgi:hypothetical protein